MRNPIIPSVQNFYEIPGERKYDYEAICCFAAAGFFLDNETYYTNLKVQRPATILEDGIESTYFKWNYNPRDISFKQAVEEFADLFEIITREEVDTKRVILPLSGGLDSRSQAAALKGYENVHTYSYKFLNSFNESGYGKEIAKQMGWDFDDITIPKGYLWDRIDDLSKINRCYSDFVNPRQMSIVERFPTMGDIFYLGHWGDVLFDDMGIAGNASMEDQIKHMYKKILKKGGLELGRRLWEYWQLDGNFEEYLYERIKRLMASIDIDDANARIRAFKSLNWAPRWTSVNLGVFAKYHPLALPYYDDRMCEFICTIPEKYLAGRRIQIEYIKMKAPELAEIPWQTFDPCNLYNYQNYNSIQYQLVVNYRRLIRKSKELIGQICTTRNWEIQYLGKGNEEKLKQNLLYPNDLVPQEISIEYYQKFMEGNHRQKVWYSHPLSMLLTMSKINNVQ